MIMIGRMWENVVEDFDFILKKAEVRVKLPKSKSTARIVLLEKIMVTIKNHTVQQNNLEVLIPHSTQTLGLFYCFSLLCTGQS